MDADEILNRIRATTWDAEHDRETFSMSRPAALELLRTRLSPEPAAPDAGVERDIPTAIATDATNELRKYLDNDGPAKWDAETMGYVHGIIQEHAAAHTASLRRNVDKASECIEAALAHPQFATVQLRNALFLLGKEVK